MVEAEVTASLTHLAREGNVAASTQNQALSALLFLYKEVLKEEIDWLEGVERAKRAVRQPLVLTRDLIHQVFAHLHGTPRLGHKDVSTTMIYTHVVNKPGLGVKSPLD